ncbi:hypothetical protein G6035_17255, partial [Arthrobacter sp. SDTb3-6]|nr:hypothetical protein [Arthrobacter sp. SDTb3-6]
MQLGQLQDQFKGITAIAATAFDDDQEVDAKAMRRHLRFMVENGITK